MKHRIEVLDKRDRYMIGDWVLNDGKPYKWTVNDYFRSKLGMQSIAEKSLTAEVLEKNGWKFEHYKQDYMVKYDLDYEGKNRWMMWSMEYHNLDVQQQDEKLDLYNLCIQRVVIPCDYVHELQHALRLCGLNDLADNFQIE